MKIIFVGAYYYQGPVRHLYRIFEIYKALGSVFESQGIETKYFVKHNEVIPSHQTIKEVELEHELEQCDLLFIWNGGMAQGQEITAKSRQLGVPIYFSELGWLPQRGTFYFDKKGVNYNSSILDWRFTPLTNEDQCFLNIHLSYYQQVLAKKTGLQEAGEFVFVPLQDERDSQITNFSDRIKTNQQLIDYICAFIPGKVVFKTHPKYDPGDLIIPERCKLYRQGSTHDFLKDANYIVTINSTVGIEALSYYKPVITLGHAFYEGRDLTYKVEDDEQFKDAIRWAQTREVSQPVIDSFLCYLFKKQWYTADLINSQKILSLIEDITNLQ